MSKLDRFKRRSPRSGRVETDAEQVLWDNLDRVKLVGSHFRRQVEIGPYRADFGSLALKLLIEVDGAVHDDPEQKNRDLRRDSWLEMEGYRVIRFSNLQVLTEIANVLAAIEAAIEDQRLLILDNDTPPRRYRADPPPGGEGEEPAHARSPA